MISDEAVEAAASVLAFRGYPKAPQSYLSKLWSEMSDDDEEIEVDGELRLKRGRDSFREEARAALEAALPHLLASRGCGTGHSGEQLKPAVGATAALAPELPEGFIAWNGGECPVPGETVEWINAKGHRYVFRASDVAGWDWHDPRTPSKYQWRIVGYRVFPAHPQKGGEG